MKNTYRFSLFIVALILFSFSGEAQFRIYDLQDMRDVQHNTYGDPIINNNTSGIINDPQTETVPFEFDINFTNINELFRLEALRLAAARREYARWLTTQRDVLLKEINKQLGKNHTSFNTAKNDFFHDYEKNRRRVESAASTASWKLSQKAKVLNEQQMAFTSELYAVKEWQTLRSLCSSQNSGLCDQLSAIKVRGTTLGSTNTTSLNQLYNNSLKDFSSREFQSAQNLAWSKGVGKIIDDKSLLNIMVNNHIKYFDGLDSETQVYLMINYLSGFYSSQSPMIYQIRLPHPKYAIPTFWGDGRTIVEMGKKRAYLSRDALLFQPDYISYIENSTICDPPEGQDLWSGNPYCDEYIDSLYARREEIIQRHLDESVIFYFPQIGNGGKINPKEELKCFDKTMPAKLTIYIEQAKPGTRELVGSNEVGHVFIGIEQGQFRRVFGYYPTEDSSRLGILLRRNYVAILKDNSGHNYDVKIEKNISAQELVKIIQEAEKFHPTYNLESYACADFGIEIGNLGSMNLPNTTYAGLAYGIYPFQGRIPGGLGEDSIESSTLEGVVTRENKKAPSKKGNCN